MCELKILYRDEDYIAVDKPSGLLVHRSPIDKRETRFALQTLRDQIGQHVFPLHRLDKPTSGVLLFALHSDAAARLAADFREQRISKEYLAVVRGFVDEPGVVDYPLSRKPDGIKSGSRKPNKKDPSERRMVSAAEDAQSALTRYEPIARVELPVPIGRYQTTRYSLLKLQPETGRKHQIRRHLHHISHPIAGDTRYGAGIHNRFFREEFGLNRLLLMATGLSFVHPYKDRRVQIEASLPEEVRPLFDAFEWHAILNKTQAFG
jgi:tRNA pseudouridine65 synthase